jgi:bla regulator protein blaR1
MAITDVVLAIGRSLELSVLIKTTVLLALGLAGAHLARSARASVRHSLLAATLGAVLLLPVATMLMPPIAITRTVQTGTPNPVLALQDDNPVIEPADSISTVVPVTSLSISPIAVLRATWALGIAAVLISLVTGLWRIRRLRQQALPWPAGEALARQLAASAGIRRRVGVLLHQGVVAPTTCGWIRPVVIMPIDAPAWAASDVDNALVHELEHVYRRDWPIHILARVACALYWFHPLVWATWQRLSLEAERACDDAVLVRTDRTAYAELLLVLARRLVSAGPQGTALSMANRSDLSSRVAAVLDVNQARGRTGRLNGAAFRVAGLLLVLFISPLAALQRSAVPPGGDAPAAGTLAFEVVSIKPNKSTEPGFVGFQPGGRFTATRVTVKQLISLAYARDNALRDFQIVGGPRWSETDHFDVQAKAEATVDGRERSSQELFAMIQALLTERFALRAHRETRPLPIYALVVDSAGTLGPRLRPAEWDCYAPPGATPPAPPAGKPDLPCGGGGSAGRLTGRGMPIAMMLGSLSRVVGRMVEDRTGLAGAFDWDLEWTPMPGEPAPPPRPGDPAGVPTDKPWILTAIQEQLGLKLESTRGPVEVVVIDSVQRPSDDAAAIFQSAPQPSASLSTSGNQVADGVDICCPEYLQQVTDRIGTNWSPQAGASGRNVMRFTIQRDGRITDVAIDRSSGSLDLDARSRQALLTTQTVGPLPTGFPNSSLTVHLNFQYQ